jgi:hypothetical protein
MVLINTSVFTALIFPPLCNKADHTIFIVASKGNHEVLTVILIQAAEYRLQIPNM